MCVAESGETRDDAQDRMRRNSSKPNLNPAAYRSYVMSAFKIHTLRQSIDVYNDNITRILMTSKESSEKRNQIEMMRLFGQGNLS